jgi:sulfur-oxidizing protein SoxZ
MADPMKMRVTLAGDIANIKVLMNHEMETGLRKDAKTGQVIPAHFIQNVTASLNGKPVMEAQWGTAISKNPFLEFKVKGAKAGDKVAVEWLDNKGDKNHIEDTVK